MLECVVRSNILGIFLIKETKLADFLTFFSITTRSSLKSKLSMHDFNSLYWRQNIVVKSINTNCEIRYPIQIYKKSKKVKMTVKRINQKPYNHWQFTVTFYFQGIAFPDPATYATTECPFQHTTEKTTMLLTTCTTDTVPSGPKVDGGSMLVRKLT